MNKDLTEMKPSNYLDNDSNSKWEWQNDGEKVIIVTRHDHPKEHEHRADVTEVPIGEMIDNPDPIIGQAHRNSPHYYKDGKVKPPKNNNKEKDTNNMSSNKSKDFRESMRLENWSTVAEQNNKTPKKSNNSEDESKGQKERSRPEFKENTAVKQMRTDMKTESKSKNSKEAKQSTKVKAQNISPKGTEGKTATNTGGKTANGGKGGKGIGGKGGNGTGGKGGVGTSGNGGHGGR